ncbi:SRPBCC family protein [Daejeonella lutea]|uniref:Polyketide cyclase / dehydrase and lipid transport n=1 Tax=Daejeonella lutea TaxID=572036 RepID=A0A1T5BAA6_9SPHI|nr:SRPBCC family protein [Daejeonella lutea]SKB43910.1 Polyketide cyclase / dehydrase and lipid transport [Daejeonella lutea]
MIVNILLIIAALLVLILVAALFVSKTYRVESEIIINRPKEEVFDYVRYLRNQDFYSKWVMSDPDKKTDFRGTDGSIGFIYAWDSENKSAGKGEQEIVDIVEGKNVDIEIRFEKPFKGVAQTRLNTEGVSSDQTKVNWSMEGTQKYPMNLMTLFMKKMLVKDMDTSLTTLKRILEKTYSHS